MTRNCTGCGSDFILEQGEIEWYEKMEFSLPNRCPECRKRKDPSALSHGPDTSSLLPKISARWEDSEFEAGTTIPLKEPDAPETLIMSPVQEKIQLISNIHIAMEETRKSTLVSETSQKLIIEALEAMAEKVFSE